MLWRRPRVLVQAIRWLQSHACSSHETTGDVLHRLPTSRWCTRLSHRGLLRVSGADARTLLQGLVTADMFSEHRTARFAMMLNAQGRVLYEIILYQRKNGGYLLECDASAREEIMKHLQRYILHSKVEVEPEALQVWSLYPGVPEAGGPLPQPGGVEALDSDPRVRELGCRLVSTPVFNVQEMWPDIQEQVLVCYHKHRYKEGVAEGVEEVAKGNCFPLEYNLDYMNGVSFDKGCYLGQELTARTHYSGVVRKRILPFELSGSSDLPPGTSIVNSGGKRVGKVVCCCGDVGLALMRVKEMTQALTSLNSDGRSVQIHVHFPAWFPA